MTPVLVTVLTPPPPFAAPQGILALSMIAAWEVEVGAASPTEGAGVSLGAAPATSPDDADVQPATAPRQTTPAANTERLDNNVELPRDVSVTGCRTHAQMRVVGQG